MKEIYLSESKSEFSDSITQSWTEQAVECYSIDCDCKRCSLAKGNYSFACQMPKVVNILLNLLGEPDKNVA